MKKKLLYHYILLFILLMPLKNFSTTAVWNGLLGSNSFINQNIEIAGNTTLLLGTTTVSASNQDITILVKEKAILASNENGPSTLILEAIYPWSITILIEKNLEFRGVENNLSIPLTIIEQGDGNITWIVQDNTELTFGSSDTQGGTLLTIYFNGSIMPKHTFEINGNGKITFKRHSKIGYQIFSSQAFTEYSIIDAVNPTTNHSTLIEYEDGATILGYQRRLAIP